MRRILPFISSLMLILVLWTGSVAHAAEAMGCAEISSSATGHFDGDSDEVPSDGDKATPHHHSACHGHCVGAPLDTQKASQPRIASSSLIAAPTEFHSGNSPGTALRPPIA